MSRQTMVEKEIARSLEHLRRERDLTRVKIKELEAQERTLDEVIFNNETRMTQLVSQRQTRKSPT